MVSFSSTVSLCCAHENVASSSLSMKDHNAHLLYSCRAEHVTTISQINIISYTVDCSSKLGMWKETSAVNLILHLNLVVLPVTNNLCIPVFVHM